MVLRARLGWALAAILAAVTVVVIVTPSPSEGGAPVVTETTIEALNVEDRSFPLVDVGRNGLSPGDMFSFLDVLLDPTSGERIGRLVSRCMVIRLTEEVFESACTGTARLPGGQVTFEGRPKFDGDPPQRANLAITGGTGDHEGAGGTLTIERFSPPSDSLTFVIKTIAG